MSTAFLIGLAFVAGLAVTLQGQFMGLMDRALGTKESIFVTYAWILFQMEDYENDVTVKDLFISPNPPGFDKHAVYWAVNG